MGPLRKLSRRSFLATVTGAAIAGGAGAAGALQPSGPSPAPKGQTGITDRDAGASADPVNGGRRRSIRDRDPTDTSTSHLHHRRGCTDTDAGANADPAFRGRTRRRGVTDSDSGARADPQGCGRGGLRTSQRPT